jgi:uncharacterized protein
MTKAAAAMSAEMSAEEARRIALAAQGFANPRPSTAPTRRHLRGVLKQIGLLQIDSVNVLVRSHYMPLFSRLGSYRSELLDSAWFGNPADRDLFEYWGHMASLMPLELHPLMRWRMAEAADHRRSNTAISGHRHRHSDFEKSALREVRERGPLSARELSSAGKSKGGWWGWSDGKRALEALFAEGLVAASGRRGFERLYDIPERVLPARVLALPTPKVEDAQRALIRIASRALGVATERDLCDYFRIRRRAGRDRIAELVEAGELIPVAVEGWPEPAFIARDAHSPRNLDAHAFLSPFDSLIWDRWRTERVFGFHYRIEIYTPSARRLHGYYVLPFLFGDRLVARVDLKSDRASRTLRVLAAHSEPGVRVNPIAEAMTRELQTLASWLGLERIDVKRRGNLAAKLHSARVA